MKVDTILPGDKSERATARSISTESTAASTAPASRRELEVPLNEQTCCHDPPKTKIIGCHSGGHLISHVRDFLESSAVGRRVAILTAGGCRSDHALYLDEALGMIAIREGDQQRHISLEQIVDISLNLDEENDITQDEMPSSR